MGHLMGRPHSNCQARIRFPGYDIVYGRLVPGTRTDYMCYDFPAWTNTSNFDAIVDWRRNDTLAPPYGAPPALVAARPTHGLLIWGEVGPAGVKLNPAFELEARPALPATAGANTLRGLAADGSAVFQVSFDGVELADRSGAEIRHFSYSVPLDAASVGRLASIQLLSPYGSTQRLGAPASAASRSGAVALAPAAPGVARLRWDPSSHPMAMVRDRTTGRIMGLLRGGDASIPTGGRPQDSFDVILSDGVRSSVATPR
jgi:hypothetical protein